jgi:hypothetical protein
MDEEKEGDPKVNAAGQSRTEWLAEIALDLMTDGRREEIYEINPLRLAIASANTSQVAKMVVELLVIGAPEDRVADILENFRRNLNLAVDLAKKELPEQRVNYAAMVERKAKMKH